MKIGLKSTVILHGCKVLLLASAAIPSLVGAQTLANAQPKESVSSGPQSQASGAATPDSADVGVQDIVVTAQRRSEVLSRVPISISVAGPAQLTTAGVVNAFNLPRVTPGLSVSPAGSGGLYFNPFIRGIGSASPSAGNDSSVAVYIDGVYQSDKSANIFDLNNIERVEVLKGPQGTLFGRNASGGAINVITKTPSLDKLTGNIEGSYARFDKWVGKLYVTGPVTDNLAVSLAYQHREGGEYARNIDPRNPGKFAGQNSDAVEGKFLWRPSDRFELIGSVQYNDLTNTDLIGGLIPAPGTTPVGVLVGGQAATKIYEIAANPSFAIVKSLRATLRARLSFDKFDIVSISGYVRNKDTQTQDYDGTTANILYFRDTSVVRDISQELQFLTNGSGPLSVTGGLYYFDGLPKLSPLQIIQGASVNGTAGSNATDADIVNTPGASRTDILARQPTKAGAAYAQATYDFGSGFKFTGGLRYTIETRKYGFNVSGIGQIAPGFFSPTVIPLVSDDGDSTKKTFRKLTWRLVLEKQFSDETLGYVSYNRGFKSGVFNMNAFAPKQPPVNPEVLDSYEVGLKTKLFNNKLQLNLASFYYDFKNIQVSILTGDAANPLLLQNAASQRLYGLDADFIFQPVRNLTLRGSASLLHSKYRKYENASTFFPDVFGNGALTPIDASGLRGIYSPKWTFSVGGDYNVDVGRGSVLLSANYFRTAPYTLTVASPIDFVREQDSLGASVTYYSPGKTYYVRAFGENLTNRKDIASRSYALTTIRGVQAPISYGVALGINF